MKRCLNYSVALQAGEEGGGSLTLLDFDSFVDFYTFVVRRVVKRKGFNVGNIISRMKVKLSILLLLFLTNLIHRNNKKKHTCMNKENAVPFKPLWIRFHFDQ